jgi:hypothetical protein
MAAAAVPIGSLPPKAARARITDSQPEMDCTPASHKPHLDWRDDIFSCVAATLATTPLSGNIAGDLPAEFQIALTVALH